MDKRIQVALIGGGVLLTILLLIFFQARFRPSDRFFLGAGGGVDTNSFSSTTLDTTTTLDTDAQIVMDRQNTRKYAIISNDSDTDLYLYLRNFLNAGAASTTVVRNGGFRLNANGGTYEILPENLWTGDVWVASTTVSGRRLLILESK